MLRLAIACTALMAAAPEPTPAPADDRAAYRAAADLADRTADAQVRLALWCEAHGLPAERVKHLAMALLADPKHAVARGLLGLVADAGAWRKPEAVAGRIKSDADLAAALAEYNGRRERTPETADAQLKLARWCKAHGLDAEAMAHLTTVTRLDPSREAAWHLLGYKKHHGKWLTDAELAEKIAETEAQRKADQHWGPLLADWKAHLRQGPERKAEAAAKLAAVTAPAAVPSVWRVFAAHGAAGQEVAVQLLGQIDGQAASRALAALAVFGRSDDVREAATESLKRRDLREYADPLIDLLHGTARYKVNPAPGPGSVGTLFIEGEWFNLIREYSTQASAAPSNNGGRALAPDVVTVTGTANPVANAGLVASTARVQLQRDIAQLNRANDLARQFNEPILRVLRAVTGANLGPTPEAWKAWWTDQQGYAYSRTSAASKPTYTQDVLVYVTAPPPPTVRRHTACFAAGTLVRTLDGPRPIEALRVGDRVLSQDTRTGSLGFRPVLTVYHNPPNQTLRVTLDGDEVVATGIHRFWVAGRGWVMARELKPGDAVRVVGGLAKVVAVAPAAVQPVFNLEVAEGHSFFVGGRGALVHDNSLVRPTPEPFDAPATLAARSR